MIIQYKMFDMVGIFDVCQVKILYNRKEGRKEATCIILYHCIAMFYWIQVYYTIDKCQVKILYTKNILYHIVSLYPIVLFSNLV